MTHEELLSIMDNYTFKDSAEPVKALRAVVELHQPYNPLPESEELCCSLCLDWNGQPLVDYPCLTIKTIEKELGA